jgi:hypothetical protein
MSCEINGLKCSTFFVQSPEATENKGKIRLAQMLSAMLSTGSVEMFSLDAGAARVQRTGRIR